ncbi:GntR family transcriptional regulator [Aquamicrobium sp. LC103]|uniref:GntR family transcriptional regulator n=1 Tax=Aquamicrobium sp. LC103 TaxID=1120658 RepID=UPI00063EA309|nr:GntR family transcriptional regulator [Aquamicrobium sp. LC103]TKT69442.1 GntR family transcriptional regulator [Aquamicrobium sp. LC103]
MAGNEVLLNGSSLHEGVREEIRRRIAAGLYIEGEAIPSAAQLSEEFGVSAITVKRALRDLQSFGVLTAVAGKGTFVKQQRRFLRELSVGMSSTEDARRRGLKLTVDLLSITREKIVDPALLSFDHSDALKLCVRKIVYADGMPVMYDATYVSTDMPDEIVEEFSNCLVTDALQNHGVGLTDIHLIIDAAPASVPAQQAFSIPSGYPMLRRLYHQKTTRPDISVVGLVESPFDRLACSVTLPVGKQAFGEREA